MKNTKNLILSLVALIALSACATKVKILDTTAISTTRGALEPGERLRQTGSVHGKFCPQTFDDRGNIGLLDEAVKSAQRRYGVDYIMDATFWNESGCITVEGTGANVTRVQQTLNEPRSTLGSKSKSALVRVSNTKPKMRTSVSRKPKLASQNESDLDI